MWVICGAKINIFPIYSPHSPHKVPNSTCNQLYSHTFSSKCQYVFILGKLYQHSLNILPTSTFSQHSPHINFLTTFSPQLTCKDEIVGLGQMYQHSHNNLPTSTFSQHPPHINIFTTLSPLCTCVDILALVFKSCKQKMWVIYGAKINGTKLS